MDTFSIKNVKKIFTPFAVGHFFPNRSTPPIGRSALKKSGVAYHSSASKESFISCSVVTVYKFVVIILS